MRRLKRVSSAASAAVLTLSSLLSIGFAPLASAAANTCTWTGAGDGTTFSDTANWSNCGGVAPQVVDTISFGSLAGGPFTMITLTNDLGHAVTGLTVTASAGGTTYTVDTLLFADGATIDETQTSDSTNYTNFTITNATAQGTLAILGANNQDNRLGADTWTLNGVLTLGPNASFFGTDVGTSGVVVQNGATLAFNAPSSTTPAVPNYPITLGGGSGTGDPVVSFDDAYRNGAGVSQDTTWSFANPITLLSNAQVRVGKQVTVQQTGSISGAGYALSLAPDSLSGGKLILAPSSNTYNTVAGTYTGTSGGSFGGQGGVSEPASTNAPKTPDTGFALASQKALPTLLVSLGAAATLLLVARKLRPAVQR